MGPKENTEMHLHTRIYLYIFLYTVHTRQATQTDYLLGVSEKLHISICHGKYKNQWITVSQFNQMDYIIIQLKTNMGVDEVISHSIVLWYTSPVYCSTTKGLLHSTEIKLIFFT